MVSSGSDISTVNMLVELLEVTFCVTCVLKGQLIEPRYKIEHYVFQFRCMSLECCLLGIKLIEPGYKAEHYMYQFRSPSLEGCVFRKRVIEPLYRIGHYIS
jgi:hypothetical protein